MQKSSRQLSENKITLAQAQLQNFLNEVNGVEFIMLVSADGFELATATKKEIDNTGKLAAVSSSILAMISAFITEIHLNGCQTITLEADNGKVFLSSIPNPRFPMVQIAVTKQDILMGQMLFSFKRLAESLTTVQ